MAILHKANYSGLALALVSFCLIAHAPAALAGGDFEVKTGQGESFEIKHNLFGKKSFSAQDRLGNKIENKKGLLGNGKTDVSLLGNEFQREKGLLGGKSTRVSTMFGDEIQTKRSWFGLGRRKTKINLSGTAGLINQALAKRRDSLGAVSAAAAADDRSPADSALSVPAAAGVDESNNQIEQSFPAVQ